MFSEISLEDSNKCRNAKQRDFQIPGHVPGHLEKFLELDHNCGHILLGVASEFRPLPAYDMSRSGEAGNRRDGPCDIVAAVMIKPNF